MAVGDEVLMEFLAARTPRGRSYWIDRANLPAEEEAVARSADVLILPWEKFRDDRDLFPAETTGIVQFLREQLADRRVAIAATEDHYLEIHLHADEHRLPSILVSAVLLPLVINLVANYCSSRWMPHDDIVEIQLFVESRGKPCVLLKYKGKFEEFSERMVAEAERCFTAPPHDAAIHPHLHRGNHSSDAPKKVPKRSG